MLFNKHHLLDNGYIAIAGYSIEPNKYRGIIKEFTRTRKAKPHMLDTVHVSVLIKCPLFVKTFILESVKPNCITSKTLQPEAYKPTLNEIKSGNHETDTLIADDISRTTEALLINPKAYQSDACDIFISQVISPISVYVESLMSASLVDWGKLLVRNDLPAPIQIYVSTLKEIIAAEWKDELKVILGD
jgi:hypothetical protein